MDRNTTIDRLNHLVHINRDAEAGFRTAAGNVKNSEIETLFHGYAKQHVKFITELQGEIGRLGGNPSDSGTLSGALHRGWMDVKSALTGHSAGSMLAACETGEQSAEAAYTEAADANPTGQTHTLIEKHRQQISAFRSRLTKLVGETEDGLEFQNNE